MKAVQRILDAYCLIAYFENESGAEEMIEIFKTARDSGQDLLLSVVNWGEVYYITMREAGEKKAREVDEVIKALPISLMAADLELARQAAQLKATKRMSYADCYAAALAKMHRAELVTGDQEFKQIEGEVKIHWIR